ncbi:MAG: epoxyqueuosine reductase QueH [bacterium]
MTKKRPLLRKFLRNWVLSKILLHTCCGPCTTYVNQWLSENSFEVTGFFYNPNIRPQQEYARRRSTMESYAGQVGLKVLFEQNDVETEPGLCELCYVGRLRKTAERARELGFECFSTTLLISPYQKHELLKNLGEKIAVETGVKFFYHDFRPGFRAGQQAAREMKLYRQKYCGCGIELKNKEAQNAQVG